MLFNALLFRISDQHGRALSGLRRRGRNRKTSFLRKGVFVFPRSNPAENPVYGKKAHKKIMKAFRPLLLLLLPAGGRLRKGRQFAYRDLDRRPGKGVTRESIRASDTSLPTSSKGFLQRGKLRRRPSRGFVSSGATKGGACPSRADRQPSGRRSRTPLHDGAGALPHTGCLRGRSADLQPRIRDSRGLGAGRCRPRGLLDPGPALRLSGMAPPFRGKSKGSTSKPGYETRLRSAPRPVTTNRPTTIRYTTT